MTAPTADPGLQGILAPAARLDRWLLAVLVVLLVACGVRYVDRHGLDAVACRIGSFLPEPETVRNLSTWLSHDDCVRMVDAALTAAAPGFAVLYGISANTRAWWDLEPGRALGYEPQDDAEDWADRIQP